MSDYIAIVSIAGGSSHGRSSSKEDAISRCLFFFRDWESVFEIPEQDLTIAVYDVDGYDHVVWDDRHIYGDGKELDIQPEYVTRHFKPKKQKKRR